jgi:xylulokinase
MAVSQGILCADIGTSSLKAALIDLEGRVLGFVRESYPADRFAQGRIHTSDWENALLRGTRRLLGSGSGAKPLGICISGNGPTLVPVGFDGTPFPPLHWYDRKVIPIDLNASPESGRRETLAVLADLPKTKSFFLPHVRWFLQHRPQEYEKTRCFFSAQEWLSFRLGAEPVTVLPSEAYIPYYWTEDQCAALGLEGEKFLPFVKLGTLIGRVSSEAAVQYNLPEGIPIAAGGPDFIMALLGVGAISPGLVCDRAGTSEGLNVCSAVPIKSRELRVLPHLEPGFWNIGGVISSSGRLFEWYRSLTGQESRSYEETLEELISPDGTGPADKALFFPQAGFHTQSCPDMLFSGGAVGNAPVSRQGFGRGLLEALGFMTRNVLDALERAGFQITEMRVSGGQGRNSRWNQLKADITGCVLLIPEIRDGELAGNAAAAALALREISTLSQGVSRMIRMNRRYVPDRKKHAMYTDAYRRYCEVRDRLEPGILRSFRGEKNFHEDIYNS